MATQPAPTDLRGRRRALGIPLKAMARGIGLRAYDVREIEDGTASPERLNHYAGWLRRLEAWPKDHLAHEIGRAEAGSQFRLPG